MTDMIDDMIEELDKPAQIQELVDTLFKMIDDRDAKCEAATEQLVDQLKVTADKYRTATGVNSALAVVRHVCEGFKETTVEQIAAASTLAIKMADFASELAEKADGMPWSEMDKLCDECYEKEFAGKDFSALDLCLELMKLDLLQNVGPAAEDIAEFLKRVGAEVQETEAKLAELDPDWAKTYKPSWED